MKGWKNSEGYMDPTASVAMKKVKRDENEQKRRLSDLMKVLKYIIRAAGFELTGRICLKDIKTGKEYK